MALALRSGTARGVFTNEAGLGSSPIAQASASTDHPTRQGIWGVFEVFIDTIVVCTITALVILTSGVLEDPAITADVASATAFPNLVGLLFLSGDVVRLTKDFFDDPDRIRTSPDEYRHLLKGKGMEPVKEEG